MSHEHTHPHEHPRVCGPRVSQQRELSGETRLDGLHGLREGEEEAVTGAIDEEASSLLDGADDHRRLRVDELSRSGTQTSLQPGRTFHVGEHERHVSGRQAPHGRLSIKKPPGRLMKPRAAPIAHSGSMCVQEGRKLPSSR